MISQRLAPPNHRWLRAVVLGAILTAGGLTACTTEPDPKERQEAADYANRYAQMGRAEQCEHESLTPEAVIKCRRAITEPGVSEPGTREWKPLEAKPMLLSWAVLLQSDNAYQVVRVYKTERGIWAVERAAETNAKPSTTADWACMVYEEDPSCQKRTDEAGKSTP